MLALKAGDNLNKEVCVPLRYAFVLITKGFFCDPGEVGIVLGMHLRVVSFFRKSRLPVLLFSFLPFSAYLNFVF